MSDLTKVSVLANVKDVDDPRHLDIHNQLRRKLEEGNLLEYWEIVEVTTPSSANTEFTVTCIELNRTPSYYFILKKDKAVDVYDSGTAAIKNKLYLKATASSATISIAVVA